MKFGNPKHARENSEHIALKKFSADAALAGGADAVRFEVDGCDVLAIKRTPEREYRICIEVERSTRNLVWNMERDFGRLNCDALLIVTPSMLMKAKVWAHLYKRRPNGIPTDVYVACAGQFTSAFFRGMFENWLGAGRASRQRRKVEVDRKGGESAN